MSPSSNTLSVKRKLVGLILRTTLAVLAITCSTLLIYEILSYRNATAKSLSTIADIIAANSSGALMFDDQNLARELISALRVEPEISRAALFDGEQQLVATYPEQLAPADVPRPGRDGVALRLNEVSIFKPVMQGERRVGTVFIRGNLYGTYRRAGIFGLVLVAVTIGAVVVAYLLSNYLQRAISSPVLELAKTATAITREQDFSVRAAKTSDDEIGALADSFNAMLDRIQSGHSALVESEERFRTLGDNMAQLAWMTDQHGQASWYNKRWYDYTGKTPEEVLNRGWENLHHPDHIDRVLTGFQRSLVSGESWEDTFPLRGRNGEYRWFLTQAIPIRSADGRVDRWFGTNTDVTEQRLAQEQLTLAHRKAVEASRAKDDFLAALSHELRTPLSPVLLLASDAAGNTAYPPEARDSFETIRKNIELEARLIDDLLDLTSIVRGKIALQLKDVSVDAVLGDALTTVRPDIALKNIEVVANFDSSRPVIRGDAVRLQQVFWNLLKNAAKFTPDGGRITVVRRVDVKSTEVHIEIHDTGIGMSESEISGVFDAFTQGDHAAPGSSHRFGGLGLGLAISRSLVDLQGGRIRAESAGRGQGSSFFVTFPLQSSAARKVLPVEEGDGNSTGAETASGNGLSVLLVEDHSPTRLAISALLERRKHRVVAVGTIREARDASSKEVFDLLISDIGLPDGTGYTLMKELATKSGIVGIALTGYGMDADIEEATRAGFLVHLTKPVNITALEDALARTRKSSNSANAAG